MTEPLLYKYHTDALELVCIQIPVDLTNNDVEDFKEYVQLLIKQMERRAK